MYYYYSEHSDTIEPGMENVYAIMCFDQNNTLVPLL